MKVLTKEMIEQMSKDLRKVFSNHHMYDYMMIWNGKRRYTWYDSDWKTHWKTERKDADPTIYAEYASKNSILFLSVDGDVYEWLHYGNGYDVLAEKVFSKYGCYLECVDSCHYDVCNDTNDDVEYTIYKGREEPCWIYNAKDTSVMELRHVAERWYNLSSETGDKGSCVIGSYLEFRYNGKLFRMTPQSRWQGSLSWEIPLPKVKAMLADIGATDIRYCAGWLD